VAGLSILTQDLSDEGLCARWIESRYYQLFCGANADSGRSVAEREVVGAIPMNGSSDFEDKRVRIQNHIIVTILCASIVAVIHISENSGGKQDAASRCAEFSLYLPGQ
jgi:hypothetical protein